MSNPQSVVCDLLQQAIAAEPGPDSEWFKTEAERTDFFKRINKTLQAEASKPAGPDLLV